MSAQKHLHKSTMWHKRYGCDVCSAGVVHVNGTGTRHIDASRVNEMLESKASMHDASRVEGDTSVLEHKHIGHLVALPFASDAQVHKCGADGGHRNVAVGSADCEPR